MPIEARLLEIIRCPVTKLQVSTVSPELLLKINTAIKAGAVHYADGSLVEEELEEALLTENGGTIYRVDANIPIMLEEKSIAMQEIE